MKKSRNLFLSSPERQRRTERIATGFSRQRGDALLLTLLVLAVLFTGVVYAMRSTMYDSLASGNTLARQRNVHVADIALRQLESLILAAYNNQPLEISGVGQAWYRNVAAGTVAPPNSYWASCLGNSTAGLNCGSLNLKVNGSNLPSGLPQTALAVVQPTGMQDAYACSTQGYRAIYYDVFINVAEPNGGTSAITETVYKLCVMS